MSTFEQDLWLAVIESGLLALILIGVGYFVNRRLEQDKADEGIRQKVAEARADAYKALWTLTSALKSRLDELSDDDVPQSDAQRLRQKLTTWYYDLGNGLYLSHPAASLFMHGLVLLEQPSVSRKQIKNHLSELRTRPGCHYSFCSRAGWR